MQKKLREKKSWRRLRKIDVENAEDYWYVVRGRTGSEERIVRELRKLLDAELHEPFLPKIVKPHGRKVIGENGKGKKVYEKERKVLFPGHSFIKSKKTPSEFAEEIPQVENIEGVFNVLHYGDDKTDIAVRNEEKEAWEALFDEEYCITESVGYKVGDKIEIISGALKGKESMILRINVNKRTAEIEMDVFGEKRVITLNLDLISVR